MPIFSPPDIDRYAATVASDPAPIVEPAPKRGAGIWPYLSVVGSNLADLGTSLYDERRYGTHEANPINFDDTSLALSKAIATAAGLGVVRLLSDSHPNWARFAGYAASVPPSLAALHNVQVARRQGR